MTTQEKMEIALNVIRSLQFQEKEKMTLLQSIMTELNVPLQDLMSDYNQHVAEVLRNSMQPVFDFLANTQNSVVKEKKMPLKEKKIKKNKTELKEKTLKLNKNGQPRKPYTRRPKANENNLPLPEAEQVPNSKEVQAPSKEKTETPEEGKPAEQNPAENLNTPPSDTEKTEEEIPKNQKINGKILYQNPNNSKSLMVSDEIIPDLKIWGVVVPYQNKKGVFGVSLFEEKKVMILKKAMDKAKSFPKFFGNEWEVMNERHKKSLIAAQNKINKVLDKLHGDPLHGKYLTYPFSGKENATVIRYTIELPDVCLD